MQPTDIFTELVAETGRRLKPLGFKKKGSCLYLRKEGNWLVIDFQKSKRNTASSVSFTINLGIASQAMREWENSLSGRIDLAAIPDVWSCHWHQRIGHHLPQRQDHWWEIDAQTLAEPLAREIGGVLGEKAVPYLLERVTDAQLLAAWERGEPGGQTELVRDKYLLTLAKLLGVPDLLQRATAFWDKYKDDKRLALPAREDLNELGILL